MSWLPAPAWSERQKLIEEKNVLGYWLTGHMFDQYREELKHFAPTRLCDLQPTRDVAKLAGIVTNIRQVQGKRGRMGIVTLDDGTESVEVLCFSEAWERYRKRIQMDEVLCVNGKIRYDDFSKRLSVTVESCNSLDEFRCQTARFLNIYLNSCDARKISDLQEILRNYLCTDGVTIVISIQKNGLMGRIVTSNKVKKIEDFLQESSIKLTHRLTLEY